MSQTQKAARFYTKGKIQVEDVPVPKVHSGGVVLEIACCGICGSDVKEFLAGPINGDGRMPHPQFGQSMPINLGHEFAGTIVEVGPNVDSKFKKGQRVAVEPSRSCRKCEHCKAGRRNLCGNVGWMGTHADGGLTRYVAVDDDMLHILPDNVSFESAAVAEPLCVAYHGVKLCGIKKGDSCLVNGAGPIGTLLIKILAALEVGWIGVSEPSTLRRETAARIGAHKIFDPTKEDIVKGCKEATDGKGVQFVFECAGYEPALQSIIDCLRKRGTFVNYAMWVSPPKVSLVHFLAGELTLIGSCGYAGTDYPEVIDLLSSGKLKVEDVITGRIALEDVVDKGIKQLIDAKDQHVKIVVYPGTYKPSS